MSIVNEGTCAYHPDRAAAETCSSCEQAICSGCKMDVAGKSVCQRCVAAIRAQVASQIQPLGETAAVASAAAVQQPAAYPPQAAYAPPAAYPPPVAYSPPAAYTPYPPASAAPAMGVGHVLGGLALGLLAGVISTAIWVAVVWSVHINIAFCAVGIGIVIAIATMKGAGGRGGNVVALISGIVGFVCCGLGALLTSSGTGYGVLFSLLCVFLGVKQAYTMPLRASSTW